MTLREQFLLLSDGYCEAKGISRSRLSTIVMNGGHVIDRIDNGGDLSTGSFERARQWFSDNWPETSPWPEQIWRPAKAEAA